MKKTNIYRIIAMMLAMMILCMAFVGCKNETTDVESGQSYVISISSSTVSNGDDSSEDNISSEDTSFEPSDETTDTESNISDESSENSNIDTSSEPSNETTDTESSEVVESSDIDVSSDVSDETTDTDVSTDVSNDTSDENSNAAPSDPDEHTHDFKAVKTKEATCTKGGSVNYECDCGEEKREATVALGHKDGEWVVIVEATTEHNGTKYLYCARCDEKIDEKSVPKLEDDTNDNSSDSGTHTHGTQAIVVDPTCTEEGYTYIECKPCGIYSKYNVVDALGHKKTSPWVTVKEATDKADGLKEQHCDRCGVLMGSEVIPMLDKYSVIATAENTALVEECIVKYINMYRKQDGVCEMELLNGKSREFARGRALQLVTNYAHDVDDTRKLATELEFGDYVPEHPETKYDWETDTVIETGNIIPAYYQPPGSEAIGRTSYVSVTVDMLAERMATLVYESESHWSYIGKNENAYMAVGVYKYGTEFDFCLFAMQSQQYD